jgi:hypothetical protein
MTPEELDQFKRVLGRMHREIQELWAEKQLLRNLIIDSGWMSERDVDSGLEGGKRHPANIRSVKEHFAPSEQALAELGLDEWLAAFDEMFPRND